MGLKEYLKKRDFKKTSEPKAGASKDKDHLIFVVQKHDASRLHYDFRLEMDGVLKSWAVPKGPMFDPKVKHLAMMVEDHPFDYLNFEGIIPEGEYGGGTVIVWDEGTYEPIELIKGKKAQEKALLKQLASGQLKIKLHGEKLNGEFALVKTHGMGENAWLMIKHKDEFATGEDITKQDKSVLSGKTIETMAKTSEKVWQHGHEEDIEIETEAPEKVDVAKILKNAPKSKVPAKIKPMKATLVDEPFDEPGWLFEVKWDGYRAVANLSKKDGVQLISRNNLPFEKYYPINDALKSWKIYPDADNLVSRRSNGLGAGLYITLGLAYKHAVRQYNFRTLFKIDTDALVIGPNPQNDAEKLFEEHPEFGLAGLYKSGNVTIDFNGNCFDNSWPRNYLFDITCTWKVIKRPVANFTLRKYFRKAFANGYNIGENVFGGAYFLSEALLMALDEADLLPVYRLKNSRMEEDHIFSILAKVLKFDIGDLGRDELPFGVYWKRLPASPETLLLKKKKVIHSTRSWENLNEQDIRAYYSALRV